MSKDSAAVAVYNTHTEAETAIRELEKAGVNMKKLSILGKDYHAEENVVGYYNAGDRMKFWGKLGAFWGGIMGLLFGSALFFVPGVGHVVALGPVGGMILGALENAVIVGGLSALGAGLYSIGIPKNSVLKYEKAVKADKFLVIFHGTEEEVKEAKERLHATNPNGIGGASGQRTKRKRSRGNPPWLPIFTTILQRRHASEFPCPLYSE